MTLLSKIRKIVYSCFLPRQIKKNRVLFESNGPYDNGYALFLYAFNNLKDIDAYFVAPPSTKKYFPAEVRKKLIFYGPGSSLADQIKHYMLINTFSVIFSSYGYCGNEYTNAKKIFLCHGIGLKASKNYVMGVAPNFDKIVLPTHFVAEAFKNNYLLSDSQIDVLPCPRKSLLKLNDDQKARFRELIGSKSNETIVLVMTTFRRLADGGVDKSSYLTIDIDLEKLNETLILNKQILAVKLHHAFDTEDLSAINQMSNIKFIKNSELFEIGMNPTSVMIMADAFISDYSSAVTDYLLLNRPIGYLIPDFEDYRKEVGGNYLFDDVEDLMPGMKFYDQTGLEAFLSSLVSGQDDYADQRLYVKSLLNGDYPESVIPEKEIINRYTDIV